GAEPMFQTPDYRGLFLRGADAGSGMDPDAASRIAPTGVGTFNGVGSLQCDELQDHAHNYASVLLSGTSAQGAAAGVSSSTQTTSSPNDPANSGPERRPKNVAVSYIVLYRLPAPGRH